MPKPREHTKTEGKELEKRGRSKEGTEREREKIEEAVEKSIEPQYAPGPVRRQVEEYGDLRIKTRAEVDNQIEMAEVVDATMDASESCDGLEVKRGIAAGDPVTPSCT